MSTDYSHFTKLAFDNLFAVGKEGKESVVINSSGQFVGTIGTISLVVSKITANGTTIGSAANTVTGVSKLKSSGTLTVSTTGILAISGTLTVSTVIAGSQIAAASSSAAGVLSIAAQSIAGAKTFKSTIAASNFTGTSSGTNTGDQTITLTGNVTGSGSGSFAASIASSAVTNVMIASNAAISGSKIVFASSSVAGVLTTGAQSFAGAKTFVTPIAGTSLAVASSSAQGVITIGTQSFAGTKTFVTPLLGTSVAVASSSAQGVITTGAQSIAGAKTFKSPAILPGITSGSAVAAGQIGEKIETIISASTSFGSTGVFFDACNASITAGIWSVTIVLDAFQNGATLTAGNSILIGLTPNSGTSSTGIVQGSNAIDFAPPSTTVPSSGGSVPGIYLNLSAKTTYFLKARATFTVATPTFQCRLTAIRIA